ncbi:MAG: Y-family DNA polymerase [Gammaproteobacteria bacterium]|nr:Y-family DNA polymerase [Gammaproteobacteria bacterium]
MYALIDANSFYTSCETVFDPLIRNKPIIVLTNNDGCICAVNRLAKELGITKFVPYFKVKKQCQQLGIVVRSSNYELYADLSANMMQVISRFSDDQYIYSIDECFLYFNNYQSVINNFKSYGRQIRRTVYQETRLPVCVGLGPTPTLAKAANHAAKSSKQYAGVAVIDNEKIRRQILAAMTVDKVWGIGRKLTAKLNATNVYTALDLARLPPKLVRQSFSLDIERTVRELNGETCISWDQVKQPKQQIYSTRSFGQRVFEQTQLREALCQHGAIAAKKLRQQQSLVATLMIFAASSPFDERPIVRKKLHRFVVPTNDTGVILAAISDAIATLFIAGVPFYKVGVGCLELIDEKYWQHDLFATSNDNPKLMQCLDEINARYGRDAIKNAAQGFEHKWAMRREFLSPNYTNDWRALPKINCQ